MQHHHHQQIGDKLRDVFFFIFNDLNMSNMSRERSEMKVEMVEISKCKTSEDLA